MSGADDLNVKFGMDISDLKAATQLSQVQIEGIGFSVDALARSVEAMGLQFRASLEGLDASRATATMEALSEATEREAFSLREMALQVHEGVESFNGFKAQLAEIAEVYAVAFGVEKIVDWARELAEATEHVTQLGQRLGMTASEVQGWQAVATLSGRGVDQFVQAMTRLTDAGVKATQGSAQQVAAFKDLGIAAEEAANPQQLLLDLADKFQAMGEGPAASARKIADALALMGRSGADMIPILDKGREGIQELIDKGVEYGTVVDASVNRRNLEAAEHLNELKLAFAGLSQTIFGDVAPSLTAFVESCTKAVAGMTDFTRNGALLKEIADDVKTAIVGLGAALGTFATVSLASTAVEAIAASNAFRALALSLALEAEVSGIAGVINVLGAALAALATGAIPAATAALEALTAAMLANPAIALATAVGALAAGIYFLTQREDDAKIATDALAAAKRQLEVDSESVESMTSKEVRQHVRNTEAQIKEAEATLANLEAKRALAAQEMKVETDPRILAADPGAAAAAAHTEGVSQKLDAAIAKVKEQLATLKDDLGELDDWAPPGGGALPKGPPKKEKREKEDKPESRVGDWSADLTAVDQKWMSDHAGMLENVQALEVTFWADILKRDDLTAAERKDVQSRYAAAVTAIRKEAIQETLADARTESQGIQREAVATLTAEKQAIAERIREVIAAGDQHLISRAEERSRVGVLIDEGVHDEQTAAANILAARIQADNVIMASYAEGTIEHKKALADRVAAWTAYQTALTTIAAKADTDRSKLNDQITEKTIAQWKSTLSPIVSSFTSAFTGMSAGTKTFVQAWQQLGQSLLSAVDKWVDDMVEKWLFGEGAKTAASVTGNATRVAAQVTADQTATASSAGAAIAQLGHAAVVAAGRAWMALEALPGGWLIAPAVAAATLAGVLALGKSIFSAEGGMGEVPSGGAIIQAHAKEMVLPADIASPMRSMLRSWGPSGMPTAAAASAAGAVPSGATNHFHFNIQATDSKSVKRLFEENGSALQDVLTRRMRNGKFGYAG